MTFTQAPDQSARIEELLRSLFIEKKQVRDLRRELSEKNKAYQTLEMRFWQAYRQKKAPTSIDSSLVDRLQKKISCLEEDVKEDSKAIGELQTLLSESRLHSQQLDKGIHYLRAKLEDIKTDKKLLAEELAERDRMISSLEGALQKQEKDAAKLLGDLSASQEALKQALDEKQVFSERVKTHELEQDSISLLQEQIRKLKEVVSQSEKEQADLLEKCRSIDQAEKELVKSKDAFASLEKETDGWAQERSQLSEKLIAAEILSQALNKELEQQKERSLQLEEDLTDGKSHLAVCEEELQQLKQEVVESLEQIKLFEAKAVEAKSESKSLQEQWQQMQEQVKEASSALQELPELKEKSQILAEQKQSLEANYEATLEEKTKLSNELHQEEQKKEFLEGQVKELQEDFARKDAELIEEKRIREKTEERVTRYEALTDEKETELRTAKQHFAKKVKETALLAQQLEEKQSEKEAISGDLQQLEKSHSQLKYELDESVSKKQSLEDLLEKERLVYQDKLSSAEEALRGQKEKLQQAQKENLHLKGIAERYQKMEQMLKNLGHIMQPSSEDPLPQPPQASDLFSSTPSNPPPKRDLFDG